MKAIHAWGEQYLAKTDYYCPSCGKQEVWQDESEGDYYQGPDLYCMACNFIFTMPTRSKDDKARSGVIFESEPNE